MKPHIKHRIVTSPFDAFEPAMQWCIYEPKGDAEPEWLDGVLDYHKNLKERIDVSV